jgi:hypothetical protein
MTRRITGLCVASVCSCVISLGAQSSTSSATVQRSGANDAAGHDVTVTGCVAKAADGRFMLTNATVEPMGMASTAGTSGTTSGGTTAGSTAGTATAGATASRPGSGSTAATDTMSWMLSGGSDLDKHVGHKIQVTGRTTWDSSMNRSMSSGSTGGATTGTTGTSAGSTAGGSTAGATTAGAASSTMANHPMVDVKTVKMISSSCS